MAIEKSAEDHLKQKEYKEALWKYEHCVLYIRKYFPTFNIQRARATIECATTLMNIAANLVAVAREFQGGLQCLDKAKIFCEECLQLDVTDYLAKVSEILASRQCTLFIGKRTWCNWVKNLLTTRPQSVMSMIINKIPQNGNRFM